MASFVAVVVALQVVIGASVRVARKHNASSSGTSKCCPSGSVASDICGSCHYYLDGWCGESEQNCGICGSAWCSDEVKTCAFYGCNSYQAGRPCQCNTDCKKNGNCCADYYGKCTNSGSVSYWANVNLQSRSALQRRIRSGHDAMSYGDLWIAYKSVWVGLSGKCTGGGIYDIYSTKCWRAGSEQCGGGGYRGEGDCYNREHSWPKSWWDRIKNDAYSDMFHVMPSDGYVNGKRGSFPFGVVNNPTWTSREGHKVGPCSSAGYSGTCFEPTDKTKGLVARGHFYVSVRYSGDFGCCNKDGVSTSAIKPWYANVLKAWNRENPVEDWERQFNDRVQGEQGNRNPFIDFPNLVDELF